MTVRTSTLWLAIALSGCASIVGPASHGPGGDDVASVDASQAPDASRAPDVQERVDAFRVETAAECMLPNGRSCPVGQRCPAGDGCNECACLTDGTLTCTTLDCAPGCNSSAECPVGQACTGPEGCGMRWQCATVGCSDMPSTWCDCANNTFTTSDGCAGRPYMHAGPCEMTDPVDAAVCRPDGAGCARSTECCGGYCFQRGAPLGSCGRPPAGTIVCGEALCTAGREYCELVFSDVPTPDSATCLPIPTSCNGRATCGCVSHRPCPMNCVDRNDGTLEFTCFGG